MECRRESKHEGRVDPVGGIRSSYVPHQLFHFRLHDRSGPSVSGVSFEWNDKLVQMSRQLLKIFLPCSVRGVKVL